MPCRPRPSSARPCAARCRLVFQNPYGSLNPRKKIGAILEAPLEINTDARRGRARPQQARAMLAQVGLRPEHYDRYPHMFSGGQRQRIAIARALMLKPALVVADEPVSALDVSIQAQVLNLLADLQQELGLAYLFISHDLGVVRHIAHDVMVMYLGQAVEQGDKKTIFARPLHPYTQALLASTPGWWARRPATRRCSASVLKGELPSPLEPARRLRVFDPLPARHRPLPRRAPGAAPDRQAARWRATKPSDLHSPFDVATFTPKGDAPMTTHPTTARPQDGLMRTDAGAWHAA